MIFNTLFLFTVAISLGFTSALPAVEKRQSRRVRYQPTAVVKLYEHSPDIVTWQDGWGETSRVGNGNSGVNTLISFKLSPDDKGKTCNLRFATPNIKVGSTTFSIFSFVPSNGVSFDPSKATWNQKTGYPDRQLATHTYIPNGPDIVYSFPCPGNGKILNYFLTSANGESNMQWYTPNGEGLYLEVASVVPSKNPNPRPRKPIQIASKDQVQLRESNPSHGTGSMQFGEVSATKADIKTTTLVAFIMPKTNWADRQCRLRFTNPTAATGSKTFALFEYVPYDGKLIFRSDQVSWNKRGGYRNRQLAVHKIGDNNKAVYTFLCPGPGKALNYELAPTGGEVGITWNTVATPEGGLVLEVL